MLLWKANLKAVGDNPDYIEDKIASIQKELKKDRPFTPYLREKAEKILEWVDEIDLAERRARERKNIIKKITSMAKYYSRKEKLKEVM